MTMMAIQTLTLMTIISQRTLQLESLCIHSELIKTSSLPPSFTQTWRLWLTILTSASSTTDHSSLTLRSMMALLTSCVHVRTLTALLWQTARETALTSPTTTTWLWSTSMIPLSASISYLWKATISTTTGSEKSFLSQVPSPWSLNLNLLFLSTMMRIQEPQTQICGMQMVLSTMLQLTIRWRPL